MPRPIAPSAAGRGRRARSVGAPAAALLAAIALSGCGGDRDAGAGDRTGWRAEIERIRIGANADESDPAVLRRWTAWEEHLARITGLPVKVHAAPDYNGVIQALASGQLELGQMGPASFANVHEQVGDKAAPILVARTAEGLSGYYSALLVRADSPYRTIQDLKGKTVGYVDFNSASGYLYPRWAMRRDGIDPDALFGEAAMSGGHTQGVMALANGQFDAVFMVASGGTPETGFTAGSVFTLARNGRLDIDDYRIVWTAGPIPNSPYVMRTDIPRPLQDILRGALAAMPYENPELWVEMGQLEGSDMRPTSVEDYREIIEMRRMEVAERRSGAGAGADAGAAAERGPTR